MTLLTRRALFATLAAGALLAPTLVHAKAPRIGPRVQFWATRSGGETLDGPNGSGNPFATALIETMENPALDFVGACAAVQARTAALSNGFQAVETPGLEAAPAWRFLPPGRERRMALVLIQSDYSASDAAPSLPGAATDGARIRQAFARAGFDARVVANATRALQAAELAAFARGSARADVAAIYATGHGVEAGGVQYMLFGDHVVADRDAGLARAAKWEDIAASAKARKLNLTIWAGCRNNPFA
jgi:hypothetical protein